MLSRRELIESWWASHIQLELLYILCHGNTEAAQEAAVIMLLETARANALAFNAKTSVGLWRLSLLCGKFGAIWVRSGSWKGVCYHRVILQYSCHDRHHLYFKEGVRSYDQPPCWFIETKEGFCTKTEFNFQETGLFLLSNMAAVTSSAHTVCNTNTLRDN